MRKDRPNQSQYRLDFERERRERRQLIEAISHERAGLTLRLWSNVQRVLLYMLNCDRGDGSFPYIETIVLNCDLSRSTVKRAISDAKALGILSTERRKNKSGRASNRWILEWDVMASLGQRNSGPNQGQNGPNRVQIGPNQVQNGPNPYKDLAFTQSSINSSSSAAVAAGVATEEEVEEVEIFKANIRRKLPNAVPDYLDAAVDSALAGGCDLQQLRERVSWFAANQSNWRREHLKGALFGGLKNSLPGQLPKQGWPYL